MARNVVFLVLDTLRRDRLSAYNEDVDFTGNIQALAEESMVFEEAVAQAPWTLPSHGSMFTGKYPWEHGATQRNLKLDSSKTLAECFSEEGYSTCAISYNAYFSGGFGLTRGFDTVENFSGSLESLVPDALLRKWNDIASSKKMESVTSLITRIGMKFFHSRFSEVSNAQKAVSRAEDFIGSEDDFFLFLNLMEAHEPYYPSKEYLERHAPGVDPSTIEQDPGRVMSGEKTDFEALRKLYDASVDELDDAVGKLLEKVGDETVVVVCSDHGQLLGEEEMYGHQFSVAEELVHVPLMARVPGEKTARIEDQLELRQLFYKVQEWAGIGSESEEVEVALGAYEFPDLASKTLSSEARERFYRRLAFARGDGCKLVREEKSGTTRLRSFNLKTGEEVEPTQELKKALESVRNSESGRLLENEDEEVKKRLEKLGYLGR